jgi:hypothetical protein
MDAIRENGSIKATPHACSGSRKKFNVAFPTFRRAFAFVKFVLRSKWATVLRMREATGETPTGSSAMVLIRVDDVSPPRELQVLLEATYEEDSPARENTGA